MNSTYAKAYTEVIQVISHFSNEDYLKIPKEKIEFYKENMDKEYKFVINPNKSIKEQNISKLAYSIIVALFMDYIGTEEENKKIKEILELNQKKAEQEKREKYKVEDIFKNEKKEVLNDTNINNSRNELKVIENKESIFSKIKKFIIRILEIKI